MFIGSIYFRILYYKLLLVTTGNITNPELESLFANNLSQIEKLFEQHSLIEMNRDAIIVH